MPHSEFQVSLVHSEILTYLFFLEKFIFLLSNFIKCYRGIALYIRLRRWFSAEEHFPCKPDGLNSDPRTHAEKWSVAICYHWTLRWEREEGESLIGFDTSCIAQLQKQESSCLKQGGSENRLPKIT